VKLIVDGKEMEVEDKRLTLVMHDGTANIRPVDDAVVTIDPEFTAWIAQRMIDHGEWDGLRDQPKFRRLWKLVWGNTVPPQRLEDGNEAMRHTAGLIVGIVGAIKANKRIFLKMPETFLHPRQQLGLADLVLELTKEGE
jgi:hypothetical protein